MRTGTILRSIDFVNQSPWYIITWLYEWSQRSAGCVVLVAIDDIPPGSSSAWVALCVRPSSLLSSVCRPRENKRGRQFGPPLFPPEKAGICLLRANPFPTLFFPYALPPPHPPPPSPPPFLLLGRVGGWLGERGFLFLFFIYPKKNSVLASC
jgi:hypothetical protein